MFLSYINYTYNMTTWSSIYKPFPQCSNLIVTIIFWVGYSSHPFKPFLTFTPAIHYYDKIILLLFSIFNLVTNNNWHFIFSFSGLVITFVSANYFIHLIISHQIFIIVVFFTEIFSILQYFVTLVFISIYIIEFINLVTRWIIKLISIQQSWHTIIIPVIARLIFNLTFIQ